MKTGAKLGFAFVAGIVAREMLSEDTRTQIGKAADGVVTDVKVRVKKAGAVAKDWWVKNIDPGPKPPTDTNTPPSSPSASA